MVPRLLTIAIALLFATACEKTNHENIDKWVRTQKGPGKLKKAVTDEGIDADLSAHAAANLIKMQHEPDVRAGLEKMSPGRRQQVLAKLTPRLWDMARVESETTLPNAQQIAAKDMLVELRKTADDAGKQQIDGYLMDWY